MKPGDRILLDDGAMEVHVLSASITSLPSGGASGRIASRCKGRRLLEDRLVQAGEHVVMMVGLPAAGSWHPQGTSIRHDG